MKKIDFLFIFVVIAIICGGLYFIPLRKNIDITLNGIEGKIGNPENTEKKSIHIKGKYTNYLFKKDSFVGNIKIDGYDETKGLINATFLDNYSRLSYLKISNGASTVNFGELHIGKGFKEVVIIKNDSNDQDMQSLNEAEDTFIVAPAKKYDDALPLIKKLRIH